MNTDIVELKAKVEQLLTAVWQQHISLEDDVVDLKASGRTAVYRFRLRAVATGLPSSIIVKAMNDQQRLQHVLTDWAGLQFVGETVAGLAPRLYAGDSSCGLMILEDMNGGIGLHDVLLGRDAGLAEEMLIAYASMLGRLHTSTFGKQERFSAICKELNVTPRQEKYVELAEVVQETIQLLDINAPPGLDDALHKMIVHLDQPEAFLAYTHGDPCPDNLFIKPDIKLFDFEYGAYRHALLEGIYGRIFFPTCWCVGNFPPALLLRMEQTYRAEIGQVCLEARDDMCWARESAIACAYWVITECGGRLPTLLEKDWDLPTGATARQRFMARCDAAIDALLCGPDELAALCAFFKACAASLQKRWPAEACMLPPYPVFRS